MKIGLQRDEPGRWDPADLEGALLALSSWQRPEDNLLLLGPQ